MIKTHNFRKIIILSGDLILLFFSFFLTFFLRSLEFPSSTVISTNAMPMIMLYIIWIIIFFIAGLYEIEKFISFNDLRNRFLKTMLAVGIISVLVFYTVPIWGITPKTILLINLLIVTGLMWLWRKFFFNNVVKSSKINVIFFGSSKEIEDFAGFINDRPQLAYQVLDIFDEDKSKEIDIERYVKEHNVEVIAVSDDMRQDDSLISVFYNIIPLGVAIVDFSNFYESVTGKVPVSVIGKAWFLENLVEINKREYENIKRVIDLALSVFVGIVFLFFLPFAAFFIKITSRGDVFYKQNRIGKNGKIFHIIKFRSMVSGAEKNGAEWSKKNDDRITYFGRILRGSRIDELPQVWNVIRGDISFFGPRPERPEFVKELSLKLPHYKMRHLVKPGLTGWAQINFPYGSSIEDALEKLQYDLFYIKNRSLALDVSIALKTLKTIISNEGR
ncbi:MAG: exopolysaccharide biosynthesis polyprenyl glycosylphosphotransferase [Parcubacteria group bacterium]|nr:exopolysaccharide biosynthesis polyprenyl glycosylphosphotransferase [Parcubacteria group bacterium]MCR4342958.1 exopolysaccharide biosynthesis polyprenyl glycosylphosphotransferase [Patescibacteria group bacterium]